MRTKRILSFILAFTIALSLSLSVFAVDSSAPMTRGEVVTALLLAADYYHPGLKKTDILKGYEDGNLNEDQNVTRAEALVMLSRAFGNLPSPIGDNLRSTLSDIEFTDVPSWAKKEINNLTAGGLLTGTGENLLSPNENITFRQLELLINRAYSLKGTNPNDDFYAYVNKKALDKSELSPGNASANTFSELASSNDARISKILSEILSKSHSFGTREQKISDFYNNILAVDVRNEQGIKPIQKYLDAVENSSTIGELVDAQCLIEKDTGIAPMLGFTLTVDPKDSTRYALCFAVPSASLTKETYVTNSGKQKNAYLNYLTELLKISKVPAEEAFSRAQSFYELERELSKNSLNAEEYGDIDKVYNLFSLSDLQKIFPGIDLSKVLASSGLKEEDKILVTDTGLLNTFAQYVSNEYLGELKTAMRIYILTMFGGTLSTDFVSAQNSFSQAFYGISGEKSIEEIAVSYVQNAMSDYIGEIYIQKYFSEDAKKDVEEMVAQIIKTFKTRINNLSWMSESTKKMALRKLDTMTVKIGYPDKWDTTMDKIEIKSVKNGGSFFSNLIAITNAQNRKLISLQGTPVDKSDFGMTVYTVNAMYNPTANDITFPSGILQAPFYDINASREENLGGIGMVIAHEITHSFDNNGAKFDENGNAANWWTKNDYEVFQSLCQNVINHFDGAEIVPGIFSNGTLTLSENIADLGGLSCALEAAKSLPNPNYKKLFENFAKTWYNTSTREYALYLSQLDVHSANKLRVNLIVQNFDEFYKAYDIKEGDGMYIAPENRVKIW